MYKSKRKAIMSPDMVVGIVVGICITIGCTMLMYITYKLSKLAIDCVVADQLHKAFIAIKEKLEKLEELEKTLNGKTHG